jgi:aspartate/tyrosine/aromatic aminotransferase
MKFSHLQPAPADSIFGLNDRFLRDSNPAKINLTVGVYQDAQGRTPILRSVKTAERQLLESETTKDYLSMDGWESFNSAVSALVLGETNPAYRQQRYSTLQTLGGTGALRLTADLLAHSLGHEAIAVSEPTWANHPGIFRAAGLELRPYRYFDPQHNDLDFNGMQDDLRDLPEGMPVLLHTVCHNPTGFDLSGSQWRELAELFVDKHFIAVFDFAYQGFDRSISQDREPIELFCARGSPLLVCNSFSKNMGLYGERVGGCTAVLESSAVAATVKSHLKQHARCSYSNPVRHGAQIAALVMNQADLRGEWIGELNEMRTRIDRQRALLLASLRDKVPYLDFSFLTRQRGMFGFSCLGSEEVQRLRDEFSIYMLNNGRINIAGVHEGNVERLCDAIARVVPQRTAAPSP